jgi:lysophospholipase L1-like esterase
VRTIVCYGDSNTWGADPSSPERFAPDVRWTGVLQAVLGPNYRVIEEGLNGRTTNVDDINEPFRNGLAYLVPCLESHRPIDLVTIMLGTNDLKARFSRRASDIAQAATLLAKTARAMPVGPGGANPKVLLISPPPVAELTDYDDLLAGGTEKSQQFARYFGIWAAKNGLEFLDAGSIVASSPTDGIHFDPPEHARLGKSIAARIREMLGEV